MSPFLPCFGLLVKSVLGFQSHDGSPCLLVLSRTPYGLLKFIFDMTPQNLLVANIPFGCKTINFESPKIKIETKTKNFQRHPQNWTQECIPVGCVPATRWPYAAVCFPGGGSPWSGGVSLVPGGLSLVPGGFSLVPGGVLPGPRGDSPWSQGGFSLVPGGFSLAGGVLPGPGGGSPYWRPPPWTEWQKGVKILPWPQFRCGR